jgi:hypothetical protein
LERLPEGLTAEELQTFMDDYLAQLNKISDNIEKLETLTSNLEAMNGNLDGNRQAIEDLTQLLEGAMGDYSPRDESED